MNLFPQPPLKITWRFERTKSQVPNLVPDLSRMDGELAGHRLLAAEASAGLLELGRPGEGWPSHPGPVCGLETAGTGARGRQLLQCPLCSLHGPGLAGHSRECCHIVLSYHPATCKAFLRYGAEVIGKRWAFSPCSQQAHSWNRPGKGSPSRPLGF